MQLLAEELSRYTRALRCKSKDSNNYYISERVTFFSDWMDTREAIHKHIVIMIFLVLFTIEILIIFQITIAREQFIATILKHNCIYYLRHKYILYSYLFLSYDRQRAYFFIWTLDNKRLLRIFTIYAL